jgi:hypothetical protein
VRHIRRWLAGDCDPVTHLIVYMLLDLCGVLIGFYIAARYTA